MVAISTNFDIDDDVLEAFNEVSVDNERSNIVNNLLKDYIKQMRIERLNKTIREIRKNAKPLDNGLTTTDLIRKLRDTDGNI